MPFDPDSHGTPLHWNASDSAARGSDDAALFWGSATKRYFDKSFRMRKVAEQQPLENIANFLHGRWLRNYGTLLDVLAPPVYQGDGWYKCVYRPFDSHSLPSPSTWETAWHGCKLEALYSIIFDGHLRPSDVDAGRGERSFRGVPGVYCHKEATSHKAEGYCNFVPLCVDRDGFWDGIFWAASMELLVDRGQSVTPPRKTDQWIQRAAGVKIVAVWLCGRNSSQMHRHSFVTRRWDSKLEANPWRDAGLPVPAELWVRWSASTLPRPPCVSIAAARSRLRSAAPMPSVGGQDKVQGQGSASRFCVRPLSCWRWPPYVPVKVLRAPSAAGGQQDEEFAGGQDEELSGGQDEELSGGQEDEELSGGLGDEELFGGPDDEEHSGGQDDEEQPEKRAKVTTRPRPSAAPHIVAELANLIAGEEEEDGYAQTWGIEGGAAEDVLDKTESAAVTRRSRSPAPRRSATAMEMRGRGSELPAVHVLLAPGDYTAPKPSFLGHGHVVCILGMYKSATHALSQYVSRYFDVVVQPTLCGKDDGTIRLDTLKVWKHVLPDDARLFPKVADGRAVTLLLTVRDLSSWMLSLSREPYDIFPCLDKRRKRDSLQWMFSKVELRCPYSLCTRWGRFASVPHLWMAYVEGYLAGKVNVAGFAGSPSKVAIVRYEDIIQRPGAVVQALQELGLPRNQEPFQAIDEGVSHSGKSRASIIQREAQLQPIQFPALLPPRISVLSQLLGYDRRSQSSSVIGPINFAES